MLKTERKQLILEELNQHHVVSLEKLVSLLETSESTVRRDLDELEAENKLRRVHGGAELPHSLQEEETIQEKSVKNLQEKKLLAQKAASLIKEQDVIFIDAGTTTAFLIHELVNKNVTVVTNSIHHAAQLVEKQIPTVMVGGSVKTATDASIGGVALNQNEWCGRWLLYDSRYGGGSCEASHFGECQTDLCLGGFIKNWTNLLCQGSTTQTRHRYHKSRA